MRIGPLFAPKLASLRLTLQRLCFGDMVTAALLEAVRPLRAAAPALAVERLVARLREQRPELDAGAEQVGEALRALQAEESEAAATSATRKLKMEKLCAGKAAGWKVNANK